MNENKTKKTNGRKTRATEQCDVRVNFIADSRQTRFTDIKYTQTFMCATVGDTLQQQRHSRSLCCGNDSVWENALTATLTISARSCVCVCVLWTKRYCPLSTAKLDRLINLIGRTCSQFKQSPLKRKTLKSMTRGRFFLSKFRCAQNIHAPNDFTLINFNAKMT